MCWTLVFPGDIEASQPNGRIISRVLLAVSWKPPGARVSGGSFLSPLFIPSAWWVPSCRGTKCLCGMALLRRVTHGLEWHQTHNHRWTPSVLPRSPFSRWIHSHSSQWQCQTGTSSNIKLLSCYKKDVWQWFSKGGFCPLGDIWQHLETLLLSQLGSNRATRIQQE